MRTTAAGSLPGTDFRGALVAMAETLPQILPWPELPARGIGSDMVGRALGLIQGLGFDLQPAGWRIIPGTSREHGTARARWRSDLDDAEELLQGFEGVIKVGLAGPLTLAASVERTTGDRLLADHGARRELAQALAEAVRVLRSDLARRLPGATVLVQIDEPSLVAVARGEVPTASGFSRHRAVDAPELAGALVPLANEAVLHCCAPGDWLPLARSAGFRVVSVDTRLFTTAPSLDRLGEWLAEGRALMAGVVDTSERVVRSPDALVREALRVLRPLELDATVLLERVDLSTACGLADWRQQDVVGQLDNLRRAAELVAERLSERR